MITSPEQYVSLNQQAISVAILSFVCADRVPDQAPLWPHQLPVLPGSELCTCEPPPYASLLALYRKMQQNPLFSRSNVD